MWFGAFVLMLVLVVFLKSSCFGDCSQSVLLSEYPRTFRWTSSKSQPKAYKQRPLK